MKSREEQASEMLNKDVKIVRHIGRIPEAEDYSEELAAMVAAARSAGEMLVQEANREAGPRGGGDKADIDDEVEAFLSKTFTEQFPDVGVIGEEHGTVNPTAARVFVIDPHDGTRDFLKGARTTSISIALVEAGRFLAALVYCPFQNELIGEPLMVTWARGDKLRRNGKLVAYKPKKKLRAETRVLVSTRVNTMPGEIFSEVCKPAKLFNCASIATRLALAAIGEFDAAFTVGHHLSDWDFAAGQALLQAAGGDLFDSKGQAIRWKATASIRTEGRGYFGSGGSELSWEIAQRCRNAFAWDSE